MIFSDIARLVVSLALFLAGMRLLCVGLRRCAGTRAETLLRRAGRSLPRAVLFGSLVTAVIQSSSAVTVLLVGLAGSGLIDTMQAAGFVAGANIGTCSTAFLVALGMQDGGGESLLLLALFALLLLLKKRAACEGCAGLYLLLTGLRHMQATLEPLADSSAVSRLLAASGTPVVGFLVGILLAAALQSSSAGLALLQALSAAAVLPLGTALPVILGQNIGTCSTALLASLGAGKEARRVALLHLWYNAAGALAALPLCLLLPERILALPMNAAAIAALHLAGNLLAAGVFFPSLRCRNCHRNSGKSTPGYTE